MNLTNLLTVLDVFGFLVIRTLLSVLWQPSIFFIAVGILSYSLRSKKESVRHKLWVAAIFIVPILPLFSWML